jgi:hypothetical protein
MMLRSIAGSLSLVVVLLAGALLTGACGGAGDSLEVAVSFSGEVESESLDGHVMLMFSTNDEREPRFQMGTVPNSQQMFGLDVEGLAPDEAALFTAEAFGWPTRSLEEIEPGEYWVQAVLHRYATFNRADGHTLSLPASWAAGQQWNREPGNLFSTPQKVTVEATGGRIEVVMDQVIGPVEEPEDTEYVRHIKMRSEMLSEFWGTDMYLGAHVLVPHGFDDHPEARFPLMIFHGHFPQDFGGFRTEPPDPDLECEFSPRFGVDCYNRIQQQEAYDFYQQWISPDFPRFLVIEIQHANQFYDDSYAVNSANIGPYGDAITYELIPYIEEQFQGIGEGWARFTYGGSTGGWEALAVQVFYPEEYNGCFAACPDPIDFRGYMTVDIYEDENAYDDVGPFGSIERPAHRDYLGKVNMTVRDYNHMELAKGTKTRSGDQFDIWEAVYSPVGEDGYPARLWDKVTGEIDPEVAEYWRENYDLRYILERDWEELGPDLEGKIHIYCGDMDNYYLNNAVYMMEDFLESTTTPYYDGEVDYGDRAEHCWNGDHENGNHISRLRYNTFYLPKIMQRIKDSAPAGADLTSWRY